MSTPHPDELATLLALPPAAREALARCEGPGWSVRLRDGFVGPLVVRNFADDEAWTWLPYDPTAILDVAAQHQTHIRHTVDLARLTGDAWTARLGKFSEWRQGDGSTARLAALRLLAAVS